MEYNERERNVKRLEEAGSLVRVQLGVMCPLECGKVAFKLPHVISWPMRVGSCVDCVD